MLSNIVIRTILLIYIIGFKPRVGHILLIGPPTYTLIFKQINNRQTRCADPNIVVPKNPVRLSPDGSDVVWLAWMRDSTVIAQRHALTCNPLI